MAPSYKAALLGCAIAISLQVGNAMAQPACGDAEQGHAALAKEFGEVPFFEGVDPQDREVRIFLNPKTGTWSLVIYPQEGIGCLIVSGQGGQPAKPLPPAGPRKGA